VLAAVSTADAHSLASASRFTGSGRSITSSTAVPMAAAKSATCFFVSSSAFSTLSLNSWIRFLASASSAVRKSFCCPNSTSRLRIRARYVSLSSLGISVHL
jgi:hypothetical protein